MSVIRRAGPDWSAPHVVRSSTVVPIDRTAEVTQMSDGTRRAPGSDLATDWSRTFGRAASILNAPMGGVAGGRLAAAVSAAGGLGMIGVGSAGSVSLPEREVAIPRSSGLPVGIGLLDWAMTSDPRLLEALHDWDDADANRLLTTIRNAAMSGSRVLAFEPVMPTGDQAHMSEMIDLTMLRMLNGRERTDVEMRTLFEGAGFTYEGVVSTPTPIAIVEARVP